MRARYSDVLNMDGLFVDCPEPNKFPLYGFIEGHVGRSKTAYTTERKTMNLPMVACRRGVSLKGLVITWAGSSAKYDYSYGVGLSSFARPDKGWMAEISVECWTSWDVASWHFARTRRRA